MRVGESTTVRFSFSDPEKDPYFAGVVAVTPRVKLEGPPETPKQVAKRASVKINVLQPDDPSVIVWEITAQNPGVAIFFVSIAEIFATTENGMFKLISGQLKYVAYAVRVVGNDEAASAPTFLSRFNDTKLQLKERMQLTLVAESTEQRPLTYGFLFLAYASRLVKGIFADNLAMLKAIDPGKGVFITYVTDGNKADVQSFLISVADPKEPVGSTLKLRALSATGLVNTGENIPLDLYGDNFSNSAQVLLRTETGEQPLPTTFLTSSMLRVEIPTNLQGNLALSVEDRGDSSNELSFANLPPIITGIRRLRDEQGKVSQLRILGLGIGPRSSAMVNGRMLKVIKERSVKTKLGGQVVISLPRSLRQGADVELRLSNIAGLFSDAVRVSLKD
jgi:hypothetical protein